MKTPRSIFAPLLGASLLLGSTVHAQSVLPPTTSSPPLPAAATKSNGKTSSKSLFESAQGSNLPLLKRGPVSVRPRFLYRIIHANGLLNPQQLEDSSSVIQTVSPGVLVEIGDAVTFNYVYSRISYSSRFFRDSDEHSASISGVYKHDRWTLTGTESYSRTTPLLIETGTQTPQENYATDLNLAVKLGDRTNLTTDGVISTRHVHQIATDPRWTDVDWTSWEITELLQYEFGPRLTLGAGVAAGYDNVQFGADMSHITPTARLTWIPTEKISVMAQGGVERRQFKAGRGGHIDNPVYRGTLNYAPLATTKLSVSANRAVSASYFANWATRATGWSAGCEQRLLTRFYLALDYNDERTRYIFTNLTNDLHRSDRVRTTGAYLRMPFIAAGSLSLIYQNGRNQSTESGRSFVSHQYGAEITYRF